MVTANLPWIESPFFEEILKTKKLTDQQLEGRPDLQRRPHQCLANRQEYLYPVNQKNKAGLVGHAGFEREGLFRGQGVILQFRLLLYWHWL
jgi:hypothetical protein